MANVFDVTPRAVPQVETPFRRIVTGDLVAELRYSDQLGAGDVELAATEPKLASAQDVDRVLAKSVSLGTATVLVTGFDHLIRDIDLRETRRAIDSYARHGVSLTCYSVTKPNSS